MIETTNNLSPTGQSRRDQILKLAVRTASDRRYGRIERRVAVIVLGGLITAGMMFVKNQSGMNRQRSRAEIAADASPKPQPANPPGVGAIQFVQTDPDILKRVVVYPSDRVHIINDDQLLTALADAGRPAGLIEFNGQTRLVIR